MIQSPTGRQRRRRCVAACGLIVLLLAGCTGGYRAKKWLDSDSSVMIQDMTEAAAKGDKSHVDRMVEALEADDPAVRFYAIQSLRKLTGQDLGYVYYKEPAERQPAVARWKRWLSDQGISDHGISDQGRNAAGMAATSPARTLGATR